MIAAADVAAIEVFLLKRLKETTAGSHASVASGSGFDVLGVHAWQPGDRLSAIDWPQSSLTNFSPVVVREFQQDAQTAILAVADASLSTRYGAAGAAIATTIARAVATLGLSAALSHDLFGLVTFDDRLRPRATVRPRGGKGHALHCLDVYATAPPDLPRTPPPLARAAGACLRRPGLVAVISDFLFADAAGIVAAFARLQAVHDVMFLLVDAAAAFELPSVHAGWVTVGDAETGERRIISRQELRGLASRVTTAQDETLRMAAQAGLDALRVPTGPGVFQTALVERMAARRRRRTCA